MGCWLQTCRILQHEFVCLIAAFVHYSPAALHICGRPTALLSHCCCLQCLSCHFMPFPFQIPSNSSYRVPYRISSNHNLVVCLDRSDHDTDMEATSSQSWASWMARRADRQAQDWGSACLVRVVFLDRGDRLQVSALGQLESRRQRRARAGQPADARQRDARRQRRGRSRLSWLAEFKNSWQFPCMRIWLQKKTMFTFRWDSDMLRLGWPRPHIRALGHHAASNSRGSGFRVQGLGFRV